MAGKGDGPAKSGHKISPRQAKSTTTTADKETADDKLTDNLEIIRSLLKKIGTIYSGIELEEGFEISRQEVAEAIAAFKAHKKEWEETKSKPTQIEQRMLALEEVVKKSLADPSRKAVQQMAPGALAPRTYASVVAPQANKTAVRIRVEGAKDMQPTELLTKAKQHIPGAYAVRQLRSNDTEVFVQSASQRDAALNMSQPEEFKILRHDFPVEVCGVPLRTKIEGGRYADNSRLIREICEATKARIPGLSINRIRWLHDGKEHERAKKNGHTRGSVVLSLPTEGLQKQVVRHGIVLNAMLYTAQMWSPKAQPKQCYNCSQWGHTQASCGRAARCGGCAGAHQTRDCPGKRVSCCNCGKEHRSWQRAACRTFQVYKGSVQRARLELLERTADIHREKEERLVAITSGKAIDDQGFTLVTSKKPDAPKRGPGRPRKEERVTSATTRSLMKIGLGMDEILPDSSSSGSKTRPKSPSLTFFT